MNLRQLRTFVLIAEHGSIRAAARALHPDPAGGHAQPARAGAKPDAELVRRSPRAWS